MLSNLSENASITLYGKGKKTRIVPISQELVKLIQIMAMIIYFIIILKRNMVDKE